MNRRVHFRRGVYFACGAVLLIAIGALVYLGISYDGTCGGFLPALAGPRPCPFGEYALGILLLYALLPGAAYWPYVVAVLLLPPLVGFLLDRRR